jgi:hypothetical protein
LTSIDAPVTKSLSCDARKTATRATSSGVSRRVVDVEPADLVGRDPAKGRLPARLVLLHRGRHVAGADRVDRDAERRELRCHRLCQADHGELAGDVVRQERDVPLLAGHRRRVDDLAASGGHHVTRDHL